MKQHFNVRVLVLLGVFVALAELLVAQRTSNRILVVNGKAVDAAVLLINGRSYVNVEALAQITNGTVSFQSNRIILTIPESAPTVPASPPKLSKEFANAALASLAQLREWKGAIETMIRFQTPADEPWFQDFHGRAEESLKLATVAASTALDHSADQLLENEFGNLAQWASDAVAARQALNATRTMSPDVLQNDPVLQKISDCSQSLSAVLVSGVFADVPACH